MRGKDTKKFGTIQYKKIFSFLYKNVFLEIDLSQGALDVMAEMYSTFLKYALSDGASLGKVLTPPYITNVMARILDMYQGVRPRVLS